MQIETKRTPRRSRGYIEWKKKVTHLEPIYIIQKKVLHKNHMSSWFAFTDRWTVTVASSGRRKIKDSDLLDDTTQRKDLVNCRDEIRFWNIQMFEDFHHDRLYHDGSSWCQRAYHRVT
jgi:hypothetical protein